MSRPSGPVRRHGQAGVLRPLLRGFGIENQQDHVPHPVEDMPPIDPGDHGQAESGTVEFFGQIKVFRIKRGFEKRGKGWGVWQAHGGRVNLGHTISQPVDICHKAVTDLR